MKNFLLLSFFSLLFSGSHVFGQANIFDPNDPVVTYNPSAPPATPADGQIGKWVRTPRLDWNTDKFKAYYYNGMVFRLRYPNGFNASDNTKKYPMILFLHGGGESAGIYDNEYQLFLEARKYQTMMDEGQWNGFLLFPQCTEGMLWDYFHFDKLNIILNNLVTNRHLDEDRVMITGLSMGGFGSLRYSGIYPKVASMAISNSPALIVAMSEPMLNGITQVPVWIANGGRDVNPGQTDVENWVLNMRGRGANIRHSYFPNGDHGIWDNVYDNPDAIKFYNTAHKANPIIYNGKKQYPANAVINSKLGLTPGFAEYQWQRNNVDIPGANANEYIATQLGTYRARFRRSAGGPWSDWSLVPATIFTQDVITGPGDVNGLAYKYYEGIWSALPNFSTLSPVKTGVTPNVDLSVRTANREYNYAFVWEGKINIPTTGKYTFELGSGDGSKFYFNSYYGPNVDPLIDNDYIHGTDPEIGAVQNLTAGSSIPFALTYFQKFTGQGMKLYWSGPGIPRQQIPNSAFSNSGVPGDGTPPTAPGNLQSPGKGTDFINLSWTASTDNLGVARYDIFENGTSKYTTTSTSFNVSGLSANTSYTYTVKAFDGAGNGSQLSNSIAVTTNPAASNLSGLNYRYYQGDWDVLPNFNALTPIKSGTVANIGLGMRNVDDYFGFVFEGYINLPTTGNYTFELASDDGSKMYFNSLYDFTRTAFINNDGLHGYEPTVSASTGTLSAGAYPIGLSYFEKWGGELLQLYWTGPGIPRQLVPASAFTTGSPVSDTQAPSVPTGLAAGSVGTTFINLSWTASSDNVGVARYDIFENGVLKYNTTTPNYLVNGLAVNTTYTYSVRAVDQAGNASGQSASISPKTSGGAGVVNGLNYRYYQGDWDVLPNFKALTPIKSGTVANIDLGLRNVDDYFGFVFEGYINLPTTGNYTFELASDDGSKMYFNSLYDFTRTAFINNDGLHGYEPTVSASTGTLSAGAYPIGISFFEKWGGELLQLYWTGPGIPRQLVPASAFTTGSPVSDTQAPSVPTGLAAGSVGTTFINLAWTASSDNVGVSRYDIFENGVLKYTSTSPTYLVNGLAANTTYTYSVRAADQAGNVSAQSSTISLKTSAAASGSSGLNYRYYQGDWDVLPNFKALTPIKSGTVANIDLGLRNVDDYFGFVFEGYINLPTTGNYTFELASDDGSKMYFNSLYDFTRTAFINNDGLHGYEPTVSANTGTLSAGAYPIGISFFEKKGGELLQLYWTGPGIPRQLVPASAFTTTADSQAPSVPTGLKTSSVGTTFINLAWTASTDNISIARYDIYENGSLKYNTTSPNYLVSGLPPNTTFTYSVRAVDQAGNASGQSASISPKTIGGAGVMNGLNYRYYQGDWNVLPNFNALTPIKSGTVANIDLGVRNVDDFFGFVFEGYINLPTTGNYTFELASDDGSKLYFNSFYNFNTTAFINNDGLHGYEPTVSASTGTLSAGAYPIGLSFFEKQGGELLQLYWTGPGIPRQLVPASAFTAPSTNTVANAITGNSLATGLLMNDESALVTSGKLKITEAYPNPFIDKFTIKYSNEKISQVDVQIYDLNGRLVMSKYFGALPVGTTFLKLDVNGRQAPKGIYLARVNVDGVPAKLVKLIRNNK